MHTSLPLCSSIGLPIPTPFSHTLSVPQRRSLLKCSTRSDQRCGTERVWLARLVKLRQLRRELEAFFTDCKGLMLKNKLHCALAINLEFAILLKPRAHEQFPAYGISHLEINIWRPYICDSTFLVHRGTSNQRTIADLNPDVTPS